MSDAGERHEGTREWAVSAPEEKRREADAFVAEHASAVRKAFVASSGTYIVAVSGPPNMDVLDAPDGVRVQPNMTLKPIGARTGNPQDGEGREESC